MIISYMQFKRIFDIILSLILILILFPFIVIIAILIRLETVGSPIFLSKRYGKNNKFFMMPKFRTMKKNTPQLATHLLTNSKTHITKLGKFLRKSSLDEVPQLISILKGDMSFVGPRPALFNQDDLIKLREQFDIHILKPGLTGLAQINGRDDISIEKKVQIEKYYKENQSIILDLNILYLTAMKVIKMKNVTH